MADYQSFKVPELKKLLTERGLPQTGNKADLIVRLQDNDKQTVTEEAPAAGTSKKVDDDLIDYEDDDLNNPAPVAAAKPAEAPEETAALASAASQSEEAAATSGAPGQNGTAAPPTAAGTSDAPAAADSAAADDALEAVASLASTQNLAPTDAQSEAEKRRKRAERFGVVAAAKDANGAAKTDEVRKLERARRFGLTNDQVSQLDSALPDGPPARRGKNKRGRGHDEEDAHGADDHAHKRRSGGPQRGRGGSGDKGGQLRGNRRGGGRQQQGKRENVPAGGKGAIGRDPAEKKKMEERAKRFGS